MITKPNIHDTALDSMRGSIARWEAGRKPWEITATDFDIRIVGDGCDVAVKRGDTVTVAVVNDEAGMPSWQVTSIMETRRYELIPYPQRLPWWRRVVRLLLGQRGYMGGGR